MPVYVDKMQALFGKMKMCHMLADSIEELHAMAERLGVDRKWFQENSSPHYDLCMSKKHLAIQLGAIEISNRKVAELIRKNRNKTLNIPAKHLHS